MSKLALLGAGGKMGLRLSSNLCKTSYDVSHVEVSEQGRAALFSTLGVNCVPMQEALQGADVVVLAVPDRLIGKILHEIIGDVQTGALVVMLDAAAPHAGALPHRRDISYFITHPCHPPIFNDETDPTARSDYFGGVQAKQHIVCALMQGPEAHYAAGEAVARAIYAPVMTAHRCTVEAIAILEPALSETVGATFAMVLREATDMAVSKGVPRDAAKDFILGHLNIELAIAFEVFPNGKFSDGALKAIEEARPKIFKDGWMERVFDKDEILKSVRSICE